MPSTEYQNAIADVLAHGNAILKFISPNDLGITGSHQYGFYLPKEAWDLYTIHPPQKGRLDKHDVSIQWPDGRATDSVVTWYGRRTRSEYRLTRFGRDFPWLTADNLGALLVLVPKNRGEMIAHVLSHDEDIDELIAALGVEPFERWGIYQNGAPRIETEEECVERKFTKFAEPLAAFPSGETFSETARRVLQECNNQFERTGPDEFLMRCIKAEYRLFRMVEQRVCQADVAGPFKNVDSFLQVAARIMNRRKARAGRSLENHVDYLLTKARIPHEMRPNIEGKPDIVIPSTATYHDAAYPRDRLFVIGVKTTCKDRWRQILNEAKKVPHKHLLTIQSGISSNQLTEMHQSGITLIVPASLHKEYPPARVIEMMNLDQFLNRVRTVLHD